MQKMQGPRPKKKKGERLENGYIHHPKQGPRPKKVWMLENVLKHKSCLDTQIKNYGSIDFTQTYTKCGIE